MPPSEEEDFSLSSWYSELNPYIVDLVGDIAGREPFIIHGESLLRYCFAEFEVDFQAGYQVLHAVYAVERFLDNLQKRGCDFDIVFFQDLRHLCVPCFVEHPQKYQLARRVIIQHLARHAVSSVEGRGTRAAVREFESQSEEFVEYLKPLPIHFILCHEGDKEDGLDTIHLRHLIYGFVSSGKNVAIINSIEWKSSKVFAPLIGRSSTGLPPISIDEEFSNPHSAWYSSDDIPKNLFELEAEEMSLRESLGLLSCRFLLQDVSKFGSELDEGLGERIQAYLLHLAVLRHCTLLERQPWVDIENCTLSFEDEFFFIGVVSRSLCLVESQGWSSFCQEKDDWDLYDLIDGFVFAFVLNKMREGGYVSPQVQTSWRALWLALYSSLSPEARRMIVQPDLPGLKEQGTQTLSVSPPVPSPSALPFSHPILNEFIEGIKLKERKESQDTAADLVFKDLHHWHNTKPIISHKKPQKLGFFARKNKQERLAGIVAYSASLTNARGNVIDPEIIITKQAPLSKNQRDKNVRSDDKSSKTKTKTKTKEAGNEGAKLGGRASAHKAAQEIQKRRELTKLANVVAYWDNTCREIEKEPSLVHRYLKAIKFLLDRSRDDMRAIGPDIYLYLSHILGKIWADTSSQPTKDPKTKGGLYLIAMVWNWLRQISATSASKSVVQTVEVLLRELKLPKLPMSIGDQTQTLCFKFDHMSLKNVPKYMGNPRAMQLEHGGPYMERRFESQPDDRVPFDPDAWQRKVLDSIDANNSLLVIAPTSAGKTFISFYAMKKVLEESDDGVLVYVAPTKALVNQIAAEIGARFTKSFGRQEGKSVWAIYTRDYRVQNPTGCQILVTVPHILQIMLLSPSYAKRANSWSRRIKRIIFDEVHCIGHTEDGVIWEQLLLLAPCPIIALSATIGNHLEFRDWLSLVQKRKGQKLDMVVHTAR